MGARYAADGARQTFADLAFMLHRWCRAGGYCPDIQLQALPPTT